LVQTTIALPERSKVRLPAVAKRRRKLARHNVPGFGLSRNTVLKGRRIGQCDIFRRPFRMPGDRVIGTRGQAPG
jgi:hypothetical protein